MPGHDIIVVGASAGGVEALLQLMSNLPDELPAAIFIVLHMPTNATSALPTILRRHTKLAINHPKDGEKIESGHIYVAPPDFHLIIKRDAIRLTRGPKENRHRPAIDPLFRTAARSFGRRVVGVVLSGTLDDGTAGLQAIKIRGGTAIVQDPTEALYSDMPQNAIDNVEVDHIAPLSGIAALIQRLAQEPVEDVGEVSMSDDLEQESEITEIAMGAIEEEKPGKPSEFACPECGGTLWEVHNGKLVRYRCRTGHAFSPESLLAEQYDAIEDALWAALRALEERASLCDRMAKRAEERSQIGVAETFSDQAKNARDNAELIRDVLLRGAEGDGKQENTGSL